MTTAKSLLGLAALLLAPGAAAFPKPASSLSYYLELPTCAVRRRAGAALPESICPPLTMC
jgi:hypothetical protein